MTSKTTIKYGLRHRNSGTLLKMDRLANPCSEYTGGQESIYSLSLHNGDDFLVGSEAALAEFLIHHPHDLRGDDPDLPEWGTIDADEVDTVKVEITEVIAPVKIELPIRLSGRDCAESRDYPPIMVRQYIEVREGVRYKRLLCRRPMEEMSAHLGKTIMVGLMRTEYRVEAVIEVPEEERDLVENGCVVLCSVESQ